MYVRATGLHSHALWQSFKEAEAFLSQILALVHDHFKAIKAAIVFKFFM